MILIELCALCDQLLKYNVDMLLLCCRCSLGLFQGLELLSDMLRDFLFSVALENVRSCGNINGK